eukprot:19902-Heterococcus_DN1.PRE.4
MGVNTSLRDPPRVRPAQTTAFETLLFSARQIYEGAVKQKSSNAFFESSAAMFAAGNSLAGYYEPSRASATS